MSLPGTERLLGRVKELSKSYPALAHELRFAVGAIWALNQASKNHKDRASYAERDRKGHLDELQEVIKAIQQGEQPTPKWMAGFYYNAAIMRIDACRERFKIALGSSHSSLSSLLSVKAEVKALKHHIGGQKAKDSAKRLDQSDVRNAMAALEELFTILENKGDRSRFNKLPPR